MQLKKNRLRFSSTQIIRFSSGSLFAILKNTVRFRLRFDKNSLKPVYKTPVWVRFDSLLAFLPCRTSLVSTHCDLLYTQKCHKHSQLYARLEVDFLFSCKERDVRSKISLRPDS